MDIIIIEDEFIFRERLTRLLRSPSILESTKSRISVASSKSEASELLDSKNFDLGFFDLSLNGRLEGLSLLAEHKGKVRFPVVISSHYDDNSIVGKAYENGAEDFLRKPFNEKSIKLVLDKYFLHINGAEFTSKLQEEFITEDEETIEELHKLKLKGLGSGPIHISGETGTGKEVVANLIKKLNFPIDAPFIAVNCNNLNSELFESQVFGHKRGAFTGALEDRQGCAKLADGGILFLDEIDKIPEKIQDKFLRFIETGKFYSLGASSETKVNLLVVSAGSQPLDELVKNGAFRRDLKARLCGTTIYLKPIRERKSDIPLLIDHFMRSHESSGRVFSITSDAKEILLNYTWPENTREIKNFVESHLLSSTTKLTAKQLRNFQTNSRSGLFASRYNILSKEIVSQIQKTGSLKEFIDALQMEIVDYQYLQTKLDSPKGNHNKARETLKMSNRQFYKYLNLGKEHFGNE